MPKFSQTYAEESDDQQKRAESALVLPSISELRVPLQHKFGRGGRLAIFTVRPATVRSTYTPGRPAAQPLPEAAFARGCVGMSNKRQMSGTGYIPISAGLSLD